MEQFHLPNYYPMHKMRQAIVSKRRFRTRVSRNLHLSSALKVMDKISKAKCLSYVVYAKYILALRIAGWIPPWFGATLKLADRGIICHVSVYPKIRDRSYFPLAVT